MTFLLYFILVAAFVPGLILQPITSEEIPVLHIKRLITIDGPGFTVKWDPINITDGSSPVIGIKVKVWKTPCVIQSVLQLEQTSRKKVVQYKHQVYRGTATPDDAPEYVAIVKADEVMATVPRIQRGVWYHVQVLAFTSTAEGQVSNSYDFKLGSSDEDDKNNSCERIISETPCSIFDC